jgi:hypothetical protein
MKLLKIKLLIIAIMLFAASSSFAALGYDVNVDTSSLTSYGDGGYLYFQYTPSNGAASTVTLSNFKMGDNTGLNGTRAGFGEVNGSAVSGVLPSSLIFANTNGINDYNHQVIQFADTLSFSLAFSGPASGGAPGGSSTFSLGLFQDAYGNNPLLNGTLFTIDLNNDGNTAVQILANEASVSPVPIPGALFLFGPGLAGLIALRKKLL